MTGVCSWKHLLNSNPHSSGWHSVSFSHGPGPLPSISYSFLLTASVVLTPVEIWWRTGSSLTEMKAGMERVEEGDGTGQRGRRTGCLLHRGEAEEPHSLWALSALSHVRVQLGCCLAWVGSHAPRCPWKSLLRVNCLQCHTASSPGP